MAKLKHLFSELHFVRIRVIAEAGVGFVHKGEQGGVGQFVKCVAIKLIRKEYFKIDESRAPQGLKQATTI